MEKEIELPSGLKIELKELTMGEWETCLLYDAQMNKQYGTNIDVFYWSKYAQYATGWQEQRLKSMTKEDGEALIVYLQDNESAGRKGPQETETIRKN